MTSTAQSCPWLMAVLFVAAMSGWDRAQAADRVDSGPGRDFGLRDNNGDGTLTLDEFVANQGENERPSGQQRFRVVDFNRDGKLTFEEFAALPGIEPSVREKSAVPDPIGDACRQGLKEWRLRFGKADRDGNLQLTQVEWQATNWRGIVAGMERIRFEDWDRDNSGAVTFAEIEAMFPVAFGLVLPSGEVLRAPHSSRIINWTHFLQIDRDHNGELSQAEFVSGYPLDRDQNAAVFQEIDQNNDGALTVREIVASPKFQLDAIEAFCWWDMNLDGFVDRDDLLKRSSSWQRSLALRLIPAFDEDRDAKLSFREFRGTPILDLTSDWYALRNDADHDGLLSWPEFFTGTSPWLVASSRVYFDKFDLDHSGSLSLNELEFEYDAAKIPPETIFRAWDRTKDGSLTLGELVAAFPWPTTDPTSTTAVERLRLYHLGWLNEADDDRDGRLSRYEFRQHCATFRPKVFDRFLTLDLDGDGRLSRDEYIRSLAGTAWAGKGESESRLFDLDDDGYLVWKEFRVSPHSGPTDQDRFAGLDLNENSRLELNEYLHIFPVEQHRDERIKFMRMDLNDDLTLNRDEWMRQGRSAASVKSEFRIRDDDSDGFVSIDEFARPGDEPWCDLRRRDFRIVDLDGDGRLSLEEYRTLPSECRMDERGPLADPVVERMQQKLDQVLQQLRERDKDGDGELKLSEWPREEIGEISVDFGMIPVKQWDLDHNSKVSAAECAKVAEIAYGVRRVTGEMLRTPAGFIVNQAMFRQLDADRDGQLTREEFVAKFSTAPEQNLELFLKLDANSSGVLDWSEVLASPEITADTLKLFLWFDKDQDGHLDQLELDNNLATWQLGIASRLMRAFDDDGDGRLSLREYRWTPLANPVADWYSIRTDHDRDSRLSWTEFYAGVPEPVGEKSPALIGLYGEYFRRFDWNHDGMLDQSELEFFTPIPPISRIYRTPADGTDVELIVDVGTLNVSYFGSPDLSPDGRTLAFDATPARGLENDYGGSRIATLVLEGPDAGKVFDIGAGNCPDWSPDGRQLTFFVNPGNPRREQPGIWISNADGTQRRHVTSGLVNPRWSADGRTLICTTGFSAPMQLKRVHVETGEQEDFLNQMIVLCVPYREPDGERIVVSLQLGDQQSMCLINSKGDANSLVELHKLKFDPTHQLFYSNTRPNWSADGREILFADNSSGPGELVRVDVAGEAPAKRVSSAAACDGTSSVWSHDRQHVYFCSPRALDKIPGLQNPRTPLAKIPKIKH